MNSLLLKYAGRMADSGATLLPESFHQMAVNAQFFLKTRADGNDIADQIANSTGYRINARKGRVTFTRADATEVSADVQAVGTLSDDGSFMWAWSHPTIEGNLQLAAWAVRQFGERQEIEELMTRGGSTDAIRIDEYMAICAYISNADGVYVGNHGGGGKICLCYYFGDQLTPEPDE